ncbi:MAG: hypothetical protein NC039_01055 [Muribaculaceae bacterium]|nr:hypothetical protein [Muribaculaceae bacterium]
MKSLRDILIAVFLLVIAFISSFLNEEGLVLTLNGLRPYIALVMCVPIIRHILDSKNHERFVKSFDKQLYILLFVQGVCVMFQFLKYGAGDYCGGLYADGGSGQVSTFLYVASFYFLCKKWDFKLGWLNNMANTKLYFIVLIPTFFNETKISFIYLLVFFLLLYPIDRKYIMRLLYITPFVLIIVGAGLILYVKTTGNYKLLNLEAIEIYLSGGDDRERLIELSIFVQDEGLDTDEVWAVDLPRFAKLVLVPYALESSGGGLMFGAGVGQFKGGNVVGLTKFQKDFKWMMNGTVIGLFWILLELGIFGTVWLLVNLVTMLYYPDNRKMAKNIKMYLAVIFTLILLYDSQMTVISSMFIMFYILMEGSVEPAQKATEEKSLPVRK